MSDSIFYSYIDEDSENGIMPFASGFFSGTWGEGANSLPVSDIDTYESALPVSDHDGQGPRAPVSDTDNSDEPEPFAPTVTDDSALGGPRFAVSDSDDLFPVSTPDGPRFAVSDSDQSLSSQPAASAELPSAGLPVFTNDQIAHQLTHDFNTWWGTSYATTSFAVGPGGTITVNITDLNSAGQTLALAALDAWTAVTGINFSTVGTGAMITFDDDAGGLNAYAGRSTGSGSTTLTADVMITTGWIDAYGHGLNTYSFQTYMHEIGHALGLGHAGNYNGSADYEDDGTGDNHYLNDSWQATVMSYFDVNENTYIDADKLYLSTPMIADILAMQALYGTSTALRTGDTIYGEGENISGYYGDAVTSGRAFTIIDNGGTDLINFRSISDDQNIDLHDETISDVGGWEGNMSIARGTVIENVYTGSGNDTISGNEADNVIRSGAGNDTVQGQAGNDTIEGQLGDDVIKGQGGDDILKGNAGHDKLLGGTGNDVLRGGGGGDKLWGGGGDDKLFGGKGADKLHGGTGADSFVFKGGFEKDRIRDFENDIDTVILEDIWSGSKSIADIIADFGGYNVSNGFFELDFANGNKITFEDVTDGNILLDDLIFAV